MRARPTARRLLAALCGAIIVAGCGAQAPQAPLHQAKKLDAATSDISTECGLAYQVTAFPGYHGKDLANLEAQAAVSARSLASVYVEDPAWIYQGETVGQLVIDASEALRACGLTRAELTLRRARSM
jgi:hypothetical protein